MKRARPLARPLALAALALSLCAVARPGTARAYTAEGWEWFKKNDFVLAPVNLGVMAYTGDYSKATFGIMTDFDYHLTGEMSLGALVNIGFGDSFIGFDFGPQFKYEFKIASDSHFPYVRAGIPLRLMVPRIEGFDAAPTGVGIGVLLGGGYRYYFHRRVGVGADLSIVPTFVVSGGQSFTFGINFSIGIDLKFF